MIQYKMGLSFRSLAIAVIFLLLAHATKAQFYETGQDPFSISWRQIKIKNYRLIFPASFEPAARKFAFTLDTFYNTSSKYLNWNHRRVSVVFHTQSSLSNGLVVYAPKRMEIYTIPPQDNDPQDWLDQLALHETRHVVQLDALNRGLTRLGSFIIGQQAVGAVSGMVPRWFLEGDAVYSETAFSNAGRGRSSYFLMPYRTLVSGKKLFHYEKALLGSYRDFVPDVYQMGYPIVKMMRDSFDSDIFAKSLHYTGRNPYLIFPFGRSLKANTGLNNRLAYQYTYSNLRKMWEKQKEFSAYSHWPVKKTRTFTNYSLPVKIGTNLILAQKWSMAQTRCFVLIDNEGREMKQITIGSNNAGRISVNQGRIAWSENKTDLRWTNRTYSEIMIFDMVTKMQNVLTRKTWYFSPAFSPDGKYIAVIEETPQYQSYLVVLDAFTGKVLKKTRAPDDNHLQHPVWRGEEIYCLAVAKIGKSILKLNATDIWEEVLPSGTKNISSFCFAGNHLVIAGENEGINNLFIFNCDGNSYQQITNSRFGAFDPWFDANCGNLYFSEYSSDGYRIASTPWNPDSYPKVPDYPDNVILPKVEHNPSFNLQNISTDTSFYSKLHLGKYSKLTNLVNVHSWLPVYYNYSVSDLANPNVYPGFLLLSQNILGTMVSSAGYSYQEGFSHFHASVNYKALYPVISWNLNAGGLSPRKGSAVIAPIPYRFNIQSALNISLPLNLSRGKYASGITPYVEWRHNRDAYYVNAEKRYYQGIDYINYGVNFYKYTRMAVRDIFPRFGISTFVKIQTTPFESKVFGNIYAFSGRLYLPGLMNNHSLQFRYAYQQQSPLNYYNGNIIAFPAGHLSQPSEELHVYNGTYALPLMYPDFHLGPLMYLKRIRTNLFYEEAHNSYHSKMNIITKDILRSVGTDLIADVHFLRIMFPFTVGARFAWLPDKKSIYSQAIFSVDLVY